jgi:EF-P beta-lysylation protein EpmB
MVTGACAVHCRYCFRRHFPYGDFALGRDGGPDPVRVIAGDPAISEVILSGGDPLTWDDRRIAELVARLSTVRHLRRLRIHTRLPVVLPSRVTPELCAILGETRLKTLVVVQVNHPQELSRDVHAALAALREAGAPLMNQGVLLRGVNDDGRTLGELSEALFDCGVIPYYLHRLDPVAGAAHFDVPPGRARALMERLRTILPGYLVPRLVRETVGGRFKQPVT